METGGHPYLMTPEGQMSMIARHFLDVYALVLGCIGLALCILWRLLGSAVALVINVVVGRLLQQVHLKIKSM